MRGFNATCVIALVLALTVSAASTKRTTLIRTERPLSPGDSISLQCFSATVVDRNDSARIINRAFEFVVGEIKDLRADVHHLGKNIQKPAPRIVYLKTELGPWLTDRLGKVFTEINGAGVKNRTCTVTGSVKRLDVIESGKYDCSLEVEASLADDQGRNLWKGTLKLTTEDWGRSFRESGYTGVVCKCVSQLAIEVLSLTIPEAGPTP